MSRVSVVHYFGATARSLSVVDSVVADLRNNGSDVSVVDLEPTTTTRQGFPPQYLARLWGHSVKPTAFNDVLRTLGASYQLLPVTDTLQPVPQEHAEPLKVAVESELLTYFRLDHSTLAGSS